MFRRLTDLAGRLRGRSATELADRAAMLGWQWLERGGLVDGPRALAPAAFARTLRPGVPLATVLGDLRAGRGVRPLPVTAEAAAARALAFGPLADGTRRLIGRADQVMGGRFDVLGLGPLDYGTPPDWHRDPVAGRRAPRLHWTRVPYLDADRVGDHKVTWEVNRHQHLLALAQAWWLTREPRYAERCVALLRHWMDENPPGEGINWASALELAMRSLSWHWLLPLLADAEALDDATLARLLAFLPLHARGIARHLSTWFAPNTHLSGEALGLLAAGVLLPHDRRAGAWCAQGLRLLRERLPMQVLPDGVYFEFSTYYQRYTADIYLHAARLAELGGAPMPPSWLARLEAALDVLAWCMRPDGRLPLVGDDDGGRLLPLDAAPFDDVRATLQHGALRFGRGDWAALAGPPTLELLFVAGTEGITTYEALRGTPPAARLRAFRDGGLAALRSGWVPDADHAVLAAGPRRWLRLRAHLHADALAVDLTLAGVPLLVDPGTGRYVGPVRDALRRSAAHNAPVLAGRDPAQVTHAFGWATLPDGAIDAAVSAPGLTWLRARHDGHAPARVTRDLLHVGPLGWLVVDRLEGDAADASVTYRCAEGVAARPVGERAVALTAGGVRCVVHALGAATGLALGTGTVSPLYGRVAETPALTLRASLGSGAPLVTFVAATDRARAADVSDTGSTSGWALLCRNGAAAWWVACGPRPPVAGHAVEGDAAWISLGAPGDGGVRSVVAVALRRLVIDGEVLADGGEALDWLRAEQADGRWRVTCHRSAAPEPTPHHAGLP